MAASHGVTATKTEFFAKLPVTTSTVSLSASVAKSRAPPVTHAVSSTDWDRFGTRSCAPTVIEPGENLLLVGLAGQHKVTSEPGSVPPDRGDGVGGGQ